MLSPKITNCEECPNILQLIEQIDCKIHAIGLNAYNNIIYSLNLKISKSDALSLLTYKRILLYKFVNSSYACQFSVEQIASKVKLLSIGGKHRDCSCNEITVPPDVTYRYAIDVRDCGTCTLHYTDIINNATALTEGHYYYYEPTNENAFIKRFVGVVSIPAQTFILDEDKKTNCASSCPSTTSTTTTAVLTTTTSTTLALTTTTTTIPLTTTTTTTLCTAFFYEFIGFICGTCAQQPSVQSFVNSNILTPGKYYYSSELGKIIRIEGNYFLCNNSIPPVHIQDITKKDTCAEVICPTTTTSTTTVLGTTTSTSTSTSTSTTTSTTTVALMTNCVGCNGVVPDYYVGVHEFCVNLDPAGGVVVFQLYAEANCDKFEILHSGARKATSGMTVANSGPFDTTYGPSNMPRPVDELDVNQFIGTDSHIAGGSIPTRNAAFAAANPTLSYITVGGIYQQLIWWNYTPADYSLNPNVILRVTTGHSSDYSAQRRCPTYTGTSTTSTSTTTPSSCVSYNYTVTAANLTASDDNTVYVRVTGCTGVIYTIKAAVSSSGSSICATSGTPFQYILVGGIETAVAVQPVINGACP